MALQMNYTDQFGNVNSASYWRVTFVAVDILAQNARAVLLGFKDADAFTNRKQPIGSKDVNVQGDSFAQMMTAYQTGGGNTDLFALAYSVAKSQDDFFSTATEV
jgi:anti-sigma-K factor RskA